MEMFQLQCPYGVMSELTHFGVNPDDKIAAREACQALPEFENDKASDA